MAYIIAILMTVFVVMANEVIFGKSTIAAAGGR